ncbi:MAG TPA: zinc ABC transporter substrate-binding protein [Bacteroidales bacterium]|nr:zinc ABC transporter substrate-binding protein [Bacteroidales bacterium]
MKKRLLILISMLAVTALFAGCGTDTPEETPDTPISQGENVGEEDNNDEEEIVIVEEPIEKVRVATTINPVDQLVQIIGGERVETMKMVPEGADAHDFEPRIRDMGMLAEVDLLFMNGLEIEPWAEKAVENSGNTDLALINLSTGVELIYLDETDDDDDHADDDGHDHGDYDPHIWMSLDNLIIMSENVKNELTALIPEGAEDFEKNHVAFVEEATALKEEYQEKFASYNGREFVTGHAAFGYMTRELGLEQKSVEGPFQEGEPTPKRLQDLINFVKEEGINTIFLEEAASPKVSETLARETGGKTVAINPLEVTGELLPSLRDTYDKVLESFNQ